MSGCTLTRLYDTSEHAATALAALEAAGFRPDEVGLVSTLPVRPPVLQPVKPSSHAGLGAAIGMLAGGGAGLAAGLDVIAIPGLGSAVAAGPLLAALTGAGAGAVAGGAIGRLSDAGTSDSGAPRSAEGPRHAACLVTVHTEDVHAADALEILNRHHPVGPSDRTQDGWLDVAAQAPDTPYPGPPPDQGTELERGDRQI